MWKIEDNSVYMKTKQNLDELFDKARKVADHEKLSILNHNISHQIDNLSEKIEIYEDIACMNPRQRVLYNNERNTYRRLKAQQDRIKLKMDALAHDIALDIASTKL